MTINRKNVVRWWWLLADMLREFQHHLHSRTTLFHLHLSLLMLVLQALSTFVVGTPVFFLLQFQTLFSFPPLHLKPAFVQFHAALPYLLCPFEALVLIWGSNLFEFKTLWIQFILYIIVSALPFYRMHHHLAKIIDHFCSCAIDCTSDSLLTDPSTTKII